MADAKISALTNLTAADPTNDMIPIVDVSDTPPASGNTKRISINNILSSSPTASGALTVTGLVTAGSATVTGDLTVRTNKLAVTSTGVGIGTVTPNAAYILDLTTANDARARQWVADTGHIATGNLTNGYQLRTLGASTDGIKIANYANSVEYLRLNSSGNVVLSGGTTTANGVGITFPATQVASSDANCLDHYEEGAWSPTVSSQINLTSTTLVSARYTKIGRVVTVSGSVTTFITTSNTLAYFALQNLPFTAATNVPGPLWNDSRNTSGTTQIAGNILYGFLPAASGTTAGSVMAITFSNTYTV